MKKIVIANNKGGVGKTTVACQLAFKLANDGYSVIVVDLDSQRNLTSTFSPTAKPVGKVLDIITSGKSGPVDLQSGEIGLIAGDPEINAHTEDEVLAYVSEGIKSLQGADYCIIDTPPTFSNIVYGALLAADFLLVPIELKKYSLDGIENVLSTFYQVQEINADLQFLGLLPSRFDAVKEHERNSLAQVVTDFGSVLVPHAIRNRVGYEQAQVAGLLVDKIKTKSGKECATEFNDFYLWFIGKVSSDG